MQEDKNIKNNNIVRSIRDTTNKTNPNDYIPSKIEDKIQGTLNFSPSESRKIDKVASADATGTVYTTSTAKDFYLTNIWYNCNNDGATLSFVVDDGTKNGNTQTLNILLQTGNNAGNYLSFPFKGIPLKRGSQIILSLNDQGACMIFGYEEDTNIYTMNSGNA